MLSLAYVPLPRRNQAIAEIAWFDISHLHIRAIGSSFPHSIMMNENQRHPFGKISVHGDGLGAPSPDLVERRAREIAMIDERDPDEFTDADWEQARRELIGLPAADAPEEPGDGVDVPEEEREVVPESPGHRAARAGFNEDQNLGETLVSDGLEEAAHDQMLEARREELEAEES